MEDEAKRIAQEHIETPEVQAQIQGLVVDATTQALAMSDGHEKNRTAIVEKIANGIVATMTGSRY